MPKVDVEISLAYKDDEVSRIDLHLNGDRVMKNGGAFGYPDHRVVVSLDLDADYILRWYLEGNPAKTYQIKITVPVGYRLLTNGQHPIPRTIPAAGNSGDNRRFAVRKA